MEVYFESIDWFHCNIYRRRFFFFTQLIAEAQLSLDEHHLSFYLHSKSPIVMLFLESLITDTYNYMIKEKQKK